LEFSIVENERVSLLE
jgi:hypothetical protein